MLHTDPTCSYCSDPATHEVSYGDGEVFYGDGGITRLPVCWYHMAAAFDVAAAAQALYWCPPQVRQLAPELVSA